MLSEGKEPEAINLPRVGALRATLVQDGHLQQRVGSATTSLLRSKASTESVTKRCSVRFLSVVVIAAHARNDIK